MVDLTGQFIGGKWELVGLLGRGSFGDVWLARHRVTRKLKALKLLYAAHTANADMVQRFVVEAQAAARIESAHVVEVDDIGHDDALNRAYLVMERLRGVSLFDYLTHPPFRLPPGEGVVVLRQVAAALDAAHAAGVVHRDLKPENVFLSWHGDGTVRVKVLDFGIAKLGNNHDAVSGVHPVEIEGAGLRRLRTAGFVGTPGYAAPEQIGDAATADARADIFAFGVCAFEVLTGAAYWRAHDNSALLAEVFDGVREPASRRLPPGVELPPAFDAWFARACAREPAARFASAGEAIIALEVALAVSDPLPWPPPRTDVEPLPLDVTGSLRIVRGSSDPLASIARGGARAGTPPPGLVSSAATVDDRAPTPPGGRGARRAVVVPEPPRRARTATFAGIGALALVITVVGLALYGRAPNGAQAASTLAAPHISPDVLVRAAATKRAPAAPAPFESAPAPVRPDDRAGPDPTPPRVEPTAVNTAHAGAGHPARGNSSSRRGGARTGASTPPSAAASVPAAPSGPYEPHGL